MMAKKKKNRITPPLQLKPFSKKHTKILKWWDPVISPYGDYQLLVCDGAIRSGKTVAIVYSFFLYTQSCFRNVPSPIFAICSQSFGAAKRNIIDTIFLPLLDALGVDYRINLGEGYIQVGHCRYQIFGCPDKSAQNALQGLSICSSIADEVALYNQS